MKNQNPLWDKDELQFARLLCEIKSNQDNFDYGAIQASMDVTREQLDELFERAQFVWESAKRGLS